jgi:hypothetical protein
VQHKPSDEQHRHLGAKIKDSKRNAMTCSGNICDNSDNMMLLESCPSAVQHTGSWRESFVIRT